MPISCVWSTVLVLDRVAAVPERGEERRYKKYGGLTGWLAAVLGGVQVRGSILRNAVSIAVLAAIARCTALSMLGMVTHHHCCWPCRCLGRKQVTSTSTLQTT